MSFGAWADSKVKKLSWVDLKLVQLSAIGLALLIAKLWPPLLSLNWHWYLLIAVLAAIKPAYKALRR